LGLWLAAGLVLSHAEAGVALPRDESLGSLAVVAALLPLVLLNSAQVAVLNAWQDFKVLNLIRALFSTLTYLAPLWLALVGMTDLRVIVGSLLLVRLVGLLVFGLACRQRCGWVPHLGAWNRDRLVSLMAVGRWMFITSLVGPLIVYLDRFIVGLQLPLPDVGLYAAPSEIPNRLLMVPFALLGALFPRVAATSGDLDATRRALGQSVRWLCALMTPIVLLGVAFAVPAMTLWLGAANGPIAAVVLQVLLVGLWLSSLSMGPITVVQAAGDLRPVALFYLLQLPMLVALLWVLTEHLGIVGAALAVAARQLVDTVGMLWLTTRLVGRPAGHWWRFAIGLVGSTMVLGLASLARTWPEALAAATAGLLVCGAIAWYLWVEPEERSRTRRWVQARWGAGLASGAE